MPPKNSAPKPYLNVRKFSNTVLTSHHAPKVFPTDVDNAPTITVGVFIDGQLHPAIDPFYITFPRRNTVTVALEKLCKAVNLRFKNHLEETEDEDKWSVFCLTSAMGIAQGEMLDSEALVEDVARHSDFWFVTKGQTFPEGVFAETEGRLKKLLVALEAAKPKPPAPTAEDVDDAEDKGVGPKKIILSKQEAAAPKPSATKKALIAKAAEAAALAFALNPTVTITATFPEFEGVEVNVTQKYDDTVYDLLTNIHRSLVRLNPLGKSEEAVIEGLSPLAVLNALKTVKLMFCDKYVKSLRDTLRNVPLPDGSAVVVCTGKYFNDHEMTLFMANRILTEVREDIDAVVATRKPVAQGDGKASRFDSHSTHAHLDELLMRALGFLDTLQEVPEDIRQRRKDSVKVIIAEQDRLATL